MTHLYRKTPYFATGLLAAVVLCFGFSAQAQRPELKRPQTDQGPPPETSAPKKSKHRTRAIAVIEFLPGGSARLVPIALWMDGKYYDASLYAANPEPLAVQPGTVYEALNYGETAGTFVVSMPKQLNGNWEADGRWSPYRAMDAKLAADAAKQAKPKSNPGKAIFTSGADEGPPVLRRPGQPGASDQTQAASAGTTGGSSSKTESSGSATSSSTGDTASAAANSGRPTLKRPTDETSASSPQSSPPASAPAASNDGPDRPTLRNPSAPAASSKSAASTGVSAASNDTDADRPVLSRGQQPQAASPKPAPSTPTAHAIPEKPSSGPLRALAAISDAGKYENRPLLYSMAPEQQQLLAQPMLALALADLRAYAAKHPTSPAVPKGAGIKDYDLRFFDLDFSNTPTIVLTAKLPQGNAGSRLFVYYATVVAHLDINGIPIKVFSSVTDTTHLDVYPRMELVDALDADANGRGDLLFRQYSDAGISYGLYRVFPYNMEKVFEGGSSL